MSHGNANDIKHFQIEFHAMSSENKRYATNITDKLIIFFLSQGNETRNLKLLRREEKNYTAFGLECTR